jgi:hypothetical protein
MSALLNFTSRSNYAAEEIQMIWIFLFWLRFISYMIMFGFFCPLLIPLTYAAVLFNSLVILIEIHYFGKTIAPPDIESTINLFYCSIFILQVLTFFFWYSNGFADPFPTNVPIFLCNAFFCFFVSLVILTSRKILLLCSLKRVLCQSPGQDSLFCKTKILV